MILHFYFIFQTGLNKQHLMVLNILKNFYLQSVILIEEQLKSKEDLVYSEKGKCQEPKTKCWHRSKQQLQCHNGIVQVQKLCPKEGICN